MGILTAAVGCRHDHLPARRPPPRPPLFFGWALLVAAVAQLVFAFSFGRSPGSFLLKLLLGLLYGVAGIVPHRAAGHGCRDSHCPVLGVMLIAQAIVETVLGFSAPAEGPAGAGPCAIGACSLFLGS